MLPNKMPHYIDSLLTSEKAQQELSSGQVVVAWYTNRTNRQSVVHSHPYYELVLPMTGAALYSCNGELYDLAKGELIFFPAGCYHSGIYDIGGEVSNRIVIQIDAMLWLKIAADCGIDKAAWPRRVTILNANIVADWDLASLFERMAMAAPLRPPTQSLLFSAQVLELQQVIHLAVAEKNISQPTATSRLVATAVAYVQAHYREQELTVETLAQECYVSREHLCRAFKKYTLESVHSYITHLRMQFCRGALAEGCGVLEACIQSGFSNYSSFVKCFQKWYGITPTAYRAALLSQPVSPQ